MLSNVDNNMTVISRTRHGKFVFLNENTAVPAFPAEGAAEPGLEDLTQKSASSKFTIRSGRLSISEGSSVNKEGRDKAKEANTLRFSEPVGKGKSLGLHLPLVKLRAKWANNPSATGNKIHRIVLTGGPCAGKSTACARLQEQLTSRGVHVFTLPEVATSMFNSGVSWQQFADDNASLATFQTELARLQVAQEDSFMSLCMALRRQCVVICDRGLMDGKAYCTPEVWEQVKERMDMTEESMMARYDAVAFLVTAADGALEYYSKQTNVHRLEDADEAREVDQNLRMWVSPILFQEYEVHLQSAQSTETWIQMSLDFVWKGFHWKIYQNEEIKSCVLMISVDPNKDLKPFLPSFLECGPEIKDTDMTRLQPIPVASQKMSPRVDVPASLSLDCIHQILPRLEGGGTLSRANSIRKQAERRRQSSITGRSNSVITVESRRGSGSTTATGRTSAMSWKRSPSFARSPRGTFRHPPFPTSSNSSPRRDNSAISIPTEPSTSTGPTPRDHFTPPSPPPAGAGDSPPYQPPVVPGAQRAAMTPSPVSAKAPSPAPGPAPHTRNPRTPRMGLLQRLFSLGS